MREEVKSILVKNEDRLDTIIKVLDKLDIKYQFNVGPDFKNIVVSLEGTNIYSKDIITLGAHYDLYPDSIGINDNSCSVALLLSFLKETKTHPPKSSMEIVFFDKEEMGMMGSRGYAREKADKINYALIFDIIGYGDTIVYSNTFRTRRIDSVLQYMGLKEVVNILPSDNLSLGRHDIPVALITAIHKEDLKEDGLHLGHLYYSIGHSPKFYSSFHNQENDNNIELINFKLIENLKNELVSTFLDKSVLCNSEGA